MLPPDASSRSISSRPAGSGPCTKATWQTLPNPARASPPNIPSTSSADSPLQSIAKDYRFGGQLLAAKPCDAAVGVVYGVADRERAIVAMLGSSMLEFLVAATTPWQLPAICSSCSDAVPDFPPFSPSAAGGTELDVTGSTYPRTSAGSTTRPSCEACTYPRTCYMSHA